MLSRPVLLFVLLLCTGYAATSSAYADEAIPYWDEQVMQAPETTPPTALCVSAIALAATLLLKRRTGPRPQRHQDFDFNSETLVFPRSQR
jgi:hypothetical protein